jgi:hypothetical protein
MMRSSFFKFAIVLNSVLFCLAAGLRVSARYITEFDLLNVFSSLKNCPSLSCVSADNVVCRDVDYLEPKRLPLIICYNGTFIIFKILMYSI